MTLGARFCPIRVLLKYALFHGLTWSLCVYGFLANILSALLPFNIAELLSPPRVILNLFNQNKLSLYWCLHTTLLLWGYNYGIPFVPY